MSVGDWILLGLLIPAALFLLWGVLNLIDNCIQFWEAARRGEDAQATRGTGSSRQ